MKPNAAPQPLPEADARHERTLEAVGCRRLFGVDLGQPPAWPLLPGPWGRMHDHATPPPVAVRD